MLLPTVPEKLSKNSHIFITPLFALTFYFQVNIWILLDLNSSFLTEGAWFCQQQVRHC